MKYALITGASSGIGLEYARQLAAKGWNLVVVSNRAEENERVAAELSSQYGVTVEPLFADLTEADAAEKIFAYTQERGIEVEVLINNAGMLLFSQLVNTPAPQLERIVALHCTTPTKLCQLFARRMVERGGGRILVMSSITAWTPYPTISHYAATKAYLHSFAQSLWYEMRGKGVSVTTVYPSAVDTPFYDLSDKMRRLLLRCGVMMTAESVARKALKSMFRSRRRCIPGLLPKIEAAICYLLPAWALLPVLKIPAVKRILERI